MICLSISDWYEHHCNAQFINIFTLQRIDLVDYSRVNEYDQKKYIWSEFYNFIEKDNI